jgi:hypothetical protein
MDGFVGFNIVAKQGTAIQRPIGFFGFAIELATAPNLFITVQDSQGRRIRNCTVETNNPSSGTPYSADTDANGTVALVSDSNTTITVTNNKTTFTYSYDRAIQNNQITLIFNALLI